MSLISPLLYNPAMVRIFSTMDTDNVISLVARDTMTNSERVRRAKQWDPLYGKEMFRTMWGTSVVWGFGMPLMRKVFDGAVHKFFDKPFVNANTEVFDTSAHSLYRHHSAYVDRWTQAARAEGGDLAQKTGALAKVLGKGANQAATKALYERISGLRFLVCAAVPASLIGAGIPYLNHRLSYKEATEQAARNQQAKESSSAFKAASTSLKPNVLPENLVMAQSVPLLATALPGSSKGHTVYSHSTSNTSSITASPTGNNPVNNRGFQPNFYGTQTFAFPTASLNYAAKAVESASLNKGFQSNFYGTQTFAFPSANVAYTSSAQSAPSRVSRSSYSKPTTFGANPFLEAAGTAMRRIHTNEKLANLIGIDGFISIPRILTFRNTKSPATDSSSGQNHSLSNWLPPSEMTNWALNEGIYVYMMYFGAQQLNGLLKQAIGSSVPGYKDTYGVADFKGAAELLNLPFGSFKRLHDSQIKTSAQPTLVERLAADFQELGLKPDANHERFAKHLAEPTVIKQLKATIEEKLLPGNYKPGSNVLIEMAADSGIVPVWRKGAFGSGAIAALKPTQTIKLAEKLEEPPAISGALNKLGSAVESLWKAETPTVKDSYDNLQALLYRMNKLHTVAALPEGQKAVESLLGKAMLTKVACLAASLVGSFIILAEGVPALQKFITTRIYNEHASQWTHAGVGAAANS